MKKQTDAALHLAKVKREENKILSRRLQATIDREAGLHKALNAALIEVAVKFGEKTEDGWVFDMPVPDAKNLKKYEIRTVVSEDRKTFTTTVREAKNEADDQGDAAGAE